MTRGKGDFTQAVQAARTRTPRGISPKEGWLTLVHAMGITALLAITFQSHSWEWGGIIRLLTQGAFLVFIIAITSRIAMARRVHPRGHERRNILAGTLPFLAAVIGGWFWIVPSSHDMSWMVTTAVAVLSCLPLAAVGLHLIVQGNRSTSPKRGEPWMTSSTPQSVSPLWPR